MEGVDDRVRIEVEDTLLQLLQVAVEFETYPAGGKNRDEDVHFTVVKLVLFEVRIHHFERGLVADPDLTDLVEVVGGQFEDMVCCVDGFAVGF